MASIYLLFVLSLVSVVYCDLPVVWMSENCEFSSTYYSIGEAIRLKASPEYYLSENFRCKFTVSVSGADHVVAKFRQLKSAKKASSGSCEDFRLDIFDGISISASTRLSGENGICGKKPPSNYYLSKSHFMTFYATVPKTQQHVEFDIVITRTHNGTCYSDEFRCANGQCVDSDLLCNGYNNCGDGSDELACALAVWIIAVIAIVSIIVLALIVFIIVCVFCRFFRRVSYGRV